MNLYKANKCNFKSIVNGLSINGTAKINANWQFNIPIYQRLYVWGNEQIKNLLDDLVRAFNKDKNKSYYLGGIVTVKNNNEKYDLIDGQQRFTTLWLVSTVLNLKEFHVKENHLKEFAYKDDDNLRLSFSIRKGVDAFFQELKLKGSTSKDANENGGLVAISEAYTQIKNYFQNAGNQEKELKLNKEHLEAFTKYAAEKIEFTFTEVPANSDLNKLFEVINARGLQLEHHDILKASMRGLIKDENARYMQLWNACADMNNYIEQNIKQQAESEITWEVLLKEKKMAFEEEENNTKGYYFENQFIDNFCKLAKKEPKENEAHATSSAHLLLDILKDDKQEYKLTDKKNKKDECESVISFNLLLLHTLRIFLKERKEKDIDTFEEKELLLIFKQHFFTGHLQDDKGRVIQFLKLLGEIRIIFDEFIIKRVSSEDGLSHQIQSMKATVTSTSIYPCRRKLKGSDEIALLQSMLYYSQSKPHYWLTAYLFHLYQRNDSLAVLQQLDNYFFCSDATGTYQEKSWMAMHNLPQLENKNFHQFIANIRSDFDLNKGDQTASKLKNNYHRFGSYTFYKLEYILWKNKETLLNQIKKSDDTSKKIWYNYKMTSKNSIEHIYPQHNAAIADTSLHDFGNLVLITTSINSEYSDLPVNEKKIKFSNKTDKGRIDSLKSYVIFNQYDNWDEKDIKDHKIEMIRYFEDYFKLTADPVLYNQ